MANDLTDLVVSMEIGIGALHVIFKPFMKIVGVYL